MNTQKEIMKLVEENSKTYFANEEPCPAATCIGCKHYTSDYPSCGIVLLESELEESYYW